jgi:Tfp pilus assembly protein PilF
MAESGVTEWTLDGALAEMHVIHNAMKDRQFAFILGAGASFTSDIPTGQGLAEKWLKDLHLRECADGLSLEQWISKCGIGLGNLTLQTAAEYYPQIFERRFEGDREAGYAELEAVMEGKSPSLGYSLLAEIIQHTRHKVVVTTNFDNLVADALAMHAHQTPLVVAHESLAGFVRPQMRRPLVAKIHRDLYLNPINDIDGVSTMEQSWKIALKKLFQYFTPIVVGYGGNDGSLMDMLLGLEPGDIAGRMIWCYREGSMPPEKALSVLRKHQGILVKIPGFDEFMLQLADKLVTDFDVAAIAERTANLGQERAERYREQASKLSEASLHGSPAEQRAGELLTQSVRSSNTWWAWQVKAKAESDIEKRKRIYLEGIEQFPSSHELITVYANFLKTFFKDYDTSEEMYKRALKLNPNSVSTLGSYANFLTDFRLDHDAAEAMYVKALAADPNNLINITNYGTFLRDQRKNWVTAEELFKRAFELDPKYVRNIGNYADLLADHIHDYEAAEKMYKLALELDPTNTQISGNYANFLADNKIDYDLAENAYKKTIEMDPTDAHARGNYAIFLEDQRKNIPAADAMYKKSLELDPANARITANYAMFVAEHFDNIELAEKLFKKAITLDRSAASVFADYAYFLEHTLNDFLTAKEMYKKASELDATYHKKLKGFFNRQRKKSLNNT